VMNMVDTVTTPLTEQVLCFNPRALQLKLPVATLHTTLHTVDMHIAHNIIRISCAYSIITLCAQSKPVTCNTSRL
jgi:hypothetical protein